MSCYGLKVEEGTPLWDMQGSLELPDDDLQADMYLWTVERLAELGYQQYEISNFAKPGYESRHNLKYWTLGEYAGFGPGAHSDLGDARYAYVRDLEAYCNGVEAQGDILSENERIPQRERDIEYIMLGLRTVRGISRQEFEYRFRLPFGPLQEIAEGHPGLHRGRRCFRRLPGRCPHLHLRCQGRYRSDRYLREGRFLVRQRDGLLQQGPGAHQAHVLRGSQVIDPQLS